MTFPTWKMLTFVVYPTVDDLANAVEASGSQISWDARQIMAKMPLAKEPVAYELVLASGRDLGITKTARLTTIFAKASEHGLDKCPPELGPQLRREYSDQPKGEWLLIAMEPIADADADDYLYVFYVRRSDDIRWLNTGVDFADSLWSPDSVWVFTRRKPQ